MTNCSTFRDQRLPDSALFAPDTPVDVMARRYAEILDWLALPARRKKPVGHWNEAILPALDLATLRLRWQIAQERYRRYGGITNIALVLGTRSGLVIGDVDPRHGGKLATLWALGWPKRTVIAKSGGGGWHVYCSCAFLPDGLPSIPGYAVGVEFRANGNIVIAPPSVHPDTGRRYRWLVGHAPWEVAIAPVPDAVVADVLAQAQALTDPDGKTARSVAVGSMADVAGIDIGWTRRQVRARALRFYRKALWLVRNRGAGRNNTLFWLTGQLLALGFSGHEVTLWADAFTDEVGGE